MFLLLRCRVLKEGWISRSLRLEAAFYLHCLRLRATFARWGSPSFKKNVSGNSVPGSTASLAPRLEIADFTYLRTAEGCLYVAVVIDLFSSMVAGWSTKAEMTAGLVADALMMTIWGRGKPDALLHHSGAAKGITNSSIRLVFPLWRWGERKNI